MPWNKFEIWPKKKFDWKLSIKLRQSFAFILIRASCCVNQILLYGKQHTYSVVQILLNWAMLCRSCSFAWTKCPSNIAFGWTNCNLGEGGGGECTMPDRYFRLYYYTCIRSANISTNRSSGNIQEYMPSSPATLALTLNLRGGWSALGGLGGGEGCACCWFFDTWLPFGPKKFVVRRDSLMADCTPIADAVPANPTCPEVCAVWAATASILNAPATVFSLPSSASLTDLADAAQSSRARIPTWRQQQ